MKTTLAVLALAVFASFGVASAETVIIHRHGHHHRHFHHPHFHGHHRTVIIRR